jgi:hypothetical protein
MAPVLRELRDQVDNARTSADLSGSSLVGVVRPGRSLKGDLGSWISVAAARGGAGRPSWQPGAAWLGEGLIGGGVLVHVGPGGRRPKLGRRERVRRARRHGLDCSGYARQAAAAVCPVSRIYLRAVLQGARHHPGGRAGNHEPRGRQEAAAELRAPRRLPAVRCAPGERGSPRSRVRRRSVRIRSRSSGCITSRKRSSPDADSSSVRRNTVSSRGLV